MVFLRLQSPEENRQLRVPEVCWPGMGEINQYLRSIPDERTTSLGVKRGNVSSILQIRCKLSEATLIFPFAILGREEFCRSDLGRWLAVDRVDESVVVRPSSLSSIRTCTIVRPWSGRCRAGRGEDFDNLSRQTSLS